MKQIKEKEEKIKKDKELWLQEEREEKMMFKASEEIEKEIIERLKIEYKWIVDGDEKLGMWE